MVCFCGMKSSARPLSISMIGWLMIISGVFALPMAFLGVPLSTFGMMLGGWLATAIILGLALAYVLIGYGLLRLNPSARIAGIVLFVLLGVNATVDTSIPGTHAKMLGAMKGSPLFSRQANRPAPPPIPRVLRLLPVGIFAVPLWFLICRKEAFE